MGLLTKIKGWLNIGGVKLQLMDYSEILSKSNPTMKGTVKLSTKSDKTVQYLEVKVIEEYTTTTGSGDTKRKETETIVLGSVKFPDRDPGIGFPLDLKPGEDKEQAFSFAFALTSRLQNAGGVLGGMGKAFSMISGDKIEYFVLAEASVKGAAFKTAAKQKVKIGE